MRKKKKWLQEAIRHPGKVKRYLARKYGSAAFTRAGEVKQQFVYKAIRELKEKPASRRPKGLLNALHLAARLEKRKKGK